MKTTLALILFACVMLASAWFILELNEQTVRPVEYETIRTGPVEREAVESVTTVTFPDGETFTGIGFVRDRDNVRVIKCTDKETGESWIIIR